MYRFKSVLVQGSEALATMGYEEGLVIDESENKGKGHKGKGFAKAQVAKVHSGEGNTNRHIRMTQRIHSFTEGKAIGGKAFVEKLAQLYRDQAGRRNLRNPRQLKICGEDAGFTVLRE